MADLIWRSGFKILMLKHKLLGCFLNFKPFFSSFPSSYNKQVWVSLIKQFILTINVFRPHSYLLVKTLLNNTSFHVFCAFLGGPQSVSQIIINNILIRLLFLFSFYQQRTRNMGSFFARLKKKKKS